VFETLTIRRITHRFAEWQENLTSQCVEVVGGIREVAHDPVDLMQLLHLKVLVLRLQNPTMLIISAFTQLSYCCTVSFNGVLPPEGDKRLGNPLSR